MMYYFSLMMNVLPSFSLFLLLLRSDKTDRFITLQSNPPQFLLTSSLELQLLMINRIKDFHTLQIFNF